ncbi:MAG: hypothetical protein ABFS09_12230 [Thermodesulfobacteriota bacterium]
MALSPLAAFNSLASYPADLQPFKTSATQVHASFEKASIDITTSDGDTVSLQRSTSHMAHSSYSQWQTSSSQATALQSQSLDNHSFSYEVQGDLSEEELKDIGELFDALSLIAEDFYQGDLEQAVAGALNLGDLGSLSSLSATFSKAEITASKITSQHPYAAADLAKTDHSEEQALARHRQAQWQQILSYLDKRKQGMAHLTSEEVEPIRDHSQEMRKMIEKTLEHHQRLAPLIRKLADKAIVDQQLKMKPGNDHEKMPNRSLRA